MKKLFIIVILTQFLFANFGINNSNYQEKQTILTSITGNRVNIDVGGNTNLKGSLIAAGYINDEGNFIDNNQLSLTTDTLTYSSLSSTLFSNSNSFGAGTNIGFSETVDKNKNTNTNTKINSSTLNFGTNTAYSSSKTQATIGLGTITVKDKENSDDITNINRDINTQTNKLYEGSAGTSVDASIDHRLFTEEGRNSIREDIKTTSNFASILVNTALKESMSLFASDNDKGTTSFFDNLKLEEAKKQATLDFMLTHPDEAKILNDKTASDEQRQKADNLLKEAVDYQLGIVTNNEVKIAYDTSSEKDIKGHTTNTGDIYILKNRQDNAYDEISTLFNELSDHYDVYNHIGTDRQDSTYKTNRAEYSEYFGDMGASWLDFRYTTNNQNSLTGFSYSDANTPTTNSIINGITYSNLDKTTGSNRRIKTEEAVILSTLKENKTPEEQYRLNAAACALIKCADGVPKTDPNYQTLKTLQENGEIYKEEQKEILTVSNNIYMENIERALDEPFGTYYPMDDMALDIASSIPDKTFMYDTGDYISDSLSANQVGTRVSGAIQLTGGFADAVTGATICIGSAGAGCVGGAALWAYGWDNYFAGTQTLFSGEQYPTYGAQALQSLGVPKEYSELVYGGLNIGTAATTGFNIAKIASNSDGMVNVGSGAIEYGIKGKVDDVGMGVLENANYAQTTYRNAFSVDGIRIYTDLAGKPINTVDDLAKAIKNNIVKVDDIPVEYIVRDGKTLILNTRTSQALEQAGVPRSQWKAVDKTGDIGAEERLNMQLNRNNLNSEGVPKVTPDSKTK